MRVLIRRHDGTTTPVVEVGVELGPDALHRSLRDIVHAAAGTPPDDLGPVWLDDRPVDPDRRADAAGLSAGSCLEVGVPGPPSARTTGMHLAARTGRHLVVVGGLTAGAAHALPRGTHVVGRGPTASIVVDDASVSRAHARLDVDPTGRVVVQDLGSTNGTFVQGRAVTAPTSVPPRAAVRLGGAVTTVRVDEPTGADPPAHPQGIDRPDGTTAVNRPPRLAVPEPSDPVLLPAPERTTGARPVFSWAMFLAPLALGLVMVRIASPAYALFALLGPVLLLASWLEHRRRNTRSTRRRHGARQRELHALARTLDERATLESTRRNAVHPDLGQVLATAGQGSARLWERRGAHPDFGRVRVGRAPITWHPPLAPARPTAPDVAAVLDRHGRLPDAVIDVSIADAAHIGVVGPESAVRAVVRALVLQAVIAHGPADLHLVAAGLGVSAPVWSFTSWLPHTADAEVPAFGAASWPGGVLGPAPASTPSPDRGGEPPRVLVLLDLHPDAPADRAGASAADPPPTDEPRGWREAASRLAARLAGRHAAIVLAPTTRDLPASCSTIITALGPDGHGRIEWTDGRARLDDVHLDGVALATASRAARHLARWRDPEAPGDAHRLADQADLLDLLGAPRGTEAAAWIDACWRRGAGRAGLPAVIGTASTGPVRVDLVTDGPHALIGGTTGSGKSELLRTLVLSLALTHPPEAVTFVLIDYKGGSAFDVCAALPHVVGLVTDLDERLAHRALRSLDAELRRRERILRRAGAEDLADHRDRFEQGQVDHPPPPRLVVVIDEFATLARDAPGFLDALVGVAQRGRSLGIHLVLATQRPQGAVNDNIRTNTNLRVALRVLGRADSVDIIDRPDAAQLDRRRPGRALVRIGGDDPVAFQVARVTDRASDLGASPTAVQDRWLVPVDDWGRPGPASGCSGPHDPPEPAPGRSVPRPTAFERAVATVGDAHRRRAGAAPRRPWVPPLPTDLPNTELSRHEHDLKHDDEDEDEVDRVDPKAGAPAARGPLRFPLGIVDDPDHQRSAIWWWRPADGPLVVHGRAEGGATAALAHLAHRVVATTSPDACHVYLIDCGGLPAFTWTAAPHVGAVIGVDDRARIERLIAFLERCWRRRRSSPPPAGPEPTLIVIVEQVGQLRAALDDLDGTQHLEVLWRIAAGAGPWGIHVALAGDRPHTVPAPVTAATSARLVLHHADPYDRALLGVRHGTGPDGPGRAITLDGLEVQLARPDEPAVVPTCEAAPRSPATPIGSLPRHVTLDQVRLPVGATGDAEGWVVALGLGDRDLQPVALDARPGDHLLITGPPRSGRTTALRSIASQLGADVAGRALMVRAPGATTTPLPGVTELPDLDAACAVLRAWPGPPHPSPILLVDDAEQISGDPLDALLRDPAGRRISVIATIRADRAARIGGHWTRAVRDSRLGLALGPRPDTAPWGVHRQARASDEWPVGRGVLVGDGRTEVLQVAQP